MVDYALVWVLVKSRHRVKTRNSLLRVELRIFLMKHSKKSVANVRPSAHSLTLLHSNSDRLFGSQRYKNITIAKFLSTCRTGSQYYHEDETLKPTHRFNQKFFFFHFGLFRDHFISITPFP